MKSLANFFHPGEVYLVVGLTEIQVEIKDVGNTLIIDGFGGPWMTPGSIRQQVEQYRRVAKEQSLIILLTTTSPIALNCFNGEYKNVLVGNKPLLDLHTEEWLAQAKLGTMYERGQLEPVDA